LWHARWAESGNFHMYPLISGMTRLSELQYIDVFSHGITDARSFHVISIADFFKDINFGHKREYLCLSGEELNELITTHLFL
jgi:hypothetical protein